MHNDLDKFPGCLACFSFQRNIVHGGHLTNLLLYIRVGQSFLVSRHHGDVDHLDTLHYHGDNEVPWLHAEPVIKLLKGEVFGTVHFPAVPQRELYTSAETTDKVNANDGRLQSRFYDDNHLVLFILFFF